MNFNFFRQKKNSVEVKSSSAVSSFGTTASVYLDNFGNIIGTQYSNNVDEIRRNVSVNTIISKKSSIINEATLCIKEKKANADVETKDKNALKFLEWIEYPNSLPSPTNKVDIFNYLIKERDRKGVSGAIFTFNGTIISANSFKNIKLAQSISYQKSASTIPTYYVQVDERKQYIFTYSPQYLNYICQTQSETMILFVSGDYDLERGCYRSKFEDISAYINLQNYVIDFATSFHQNSCFPSQVVQISYKNLEAGQQLNNTQKTEFEQTVKEIISQIKQSQSAKNAGRNIVVGHPNIDVQITALSLPTNASDNVTYQNLVSGKIYAFVDGGSVDAFEGKSEYANNATAKLQELYDGCFRSVNSTLISSLNMFMRNMLLLMKTTIDVKNLYLDLNVSEVQIYQKQSKAEIVMFVQNNLLTINEGREKLSGISEQYADLQDKPIGDVFNAQLGGKQDTSQAINPKPQ